VYLTTPRLVIRDWRLADDAEAAIAIYGDPKVTQWIGDKSSDTTVEAVKARLVRYCDRAAEFPGLGCWTVECRHTQAVIGTLLLMPLPDRNHAPSGLTEIGWHFAPHSWGQGFATEAATAVMKYGFQVLKQNAIYAVALPNNLASIRVMQRLNMVDLGTTEDYYGGRLLQLYGRWADT
jgi:RimJ/RimL family protein N-acetyltransferase